MPQLRKQPAYCYITTPIYYPSAAPHAGTAYSALIADFLKRHRVQRGIKTFLTTGTDEHGKKMAEAAAAANMSPQAFVDHNAQIFVDFFAQLQISYDKFIRTTDQVHEKVVQTVFNKLKAAGHISRGQWHSLYCTGCEENYTASQAQRNNANELVCRVGHPLAEINEPSYFVHVSNAGEWVLDQLRTKAIQVFPEWRVTELVGTFFEKGLKDLSITRQSVSWGIKVPDDPSQTIYVWVDALFAYLSALGYETDNDAAYQQYWAQRDCETIHVIGKEITRFHCIYWPIFLKLLNVKTPTRILAHGWLVAEDGSKMSKSLGNAVDPVAWVKRYGVDAVRYFFLKALPPEGDSRCGEELLRTVYNADLANSLGNLISRVVGMARKYQDGIIVPPGELDAKIHSVSKMLLQLPHLFDACVNAFDFVGAFKHVLAAVATINHLIEEQKPWVLHANGGARATAPVVFVAAACARAVFVLLQPVFPEAAKKAFGQLGLNDQQTTYGSLSDLTTIVGTKPVGGAPLFQRLNNDDQ